MVEVNDVFHEGKDQGSPFFRNENRERILEFALNLPQFSIEFIEGRDKTQLTVMVSWLRTNLRKEWFFEDVGLF